MENLTKQTVTTQAGTADVPQPAPALTPEEVLANLRAVRAQIVDVTPLTPQQRKKLGQQVRTTNPVLQASINVIGVLDTIAQAVGLPAAEVRQMHEEANRWTVVEDEIRAMLNGVAGANLIRRQRVALVAGQAAAIGAQLARSPENAVLVPHVQELKRLKSYTRRKKTSAAPAPQPAEHPSSKDAGTAGGGQA